MFVMTLIIFPVFSRDTSRNTVRDNALENVLNKATAYCERMRKMAFRFYCREKIIEKLEWYGKLKKRQSHSHNYQITIRNGKINEIRDKLSTESNQLKLVNQNIKTYFYSNYSIFLPLSCFSQRAREHHHYTLIKKEKIQKWDTYHIKFSPIGTGEENVKGEAWISIKDGAVLKIKVHPDVIVGIERMRKEATKYGTEMEIEDIHWYMKVDKAIHFPSRTIFVETHFTRNPTEEKMELEKISTEIIYDNYQFFNIETKVTKERGLEEPSPPEN